MTTSTVKTPRAEGTGALKLSYEGSVTGQAERAFGAANLSDRHALRLHIRGPGVNSSVKVQTTLQSASGGSFTRELEIRNFEMREHLIFPAEFRAHASPAGQTPRWADIHTISLR